MDRFITNVQMEEFLKDYKENSQTILLEEGAERNELEKITKANGMDIKNSRDLGIFKTIYAFSNEANANGAILPKKELLRILPQIIGKPININHDRSIVVGHYIDYKYLDKEDTVVAYGVYYKSYYSDLWKKANKLFKSKKLSSSFEIWSPKDKRREKADGTYELRSMEIAGGALIYEDEDNQPAFKNAKVLMMAKEKAENNLELVYASKHKEEELICVNKLNTSDIPNIPTALKINCSNCEEAFETADVVNIKCPKCRAILNREGVMQYPPQVIDFKIMCPGCQINNWLILSKNVDNAKLRCMSCTKEYNILFTKPKKSFTNRMNFIYTGNVTCYQCHTRIPVESVSSLNKRTTKCPKCGLNFSFDTYNETFKKISNIEEIIKDIVNKSSEKGGKPMDKKETVAKTSEQKIDKNEKPIKAEEEKKETPKQDESKKEEVKKEETKVEEKPEEPKVKEPKKDDDKKEEQPEKPKVDDAPKPEVKDEKKEEQKVEEKQDEEQKVEVKDDKKIEENKEEKKVDVEKVEKDLTKLEDEVEKAKKRDMQIASLIEKHQKLIKKAVTKIRTLRKESKTVIESASDKETLLKAGVKKAVKQYIEFKKQAEEKIEFYKANAITIIERRDIVGEGLTDEELVNDDKFERAKLEMELAKTKAKFNIADEIVSSKKRDNSYYAKMKKKIDDIACGRNKKK